ncbi:MAG: peptidyl-prolyl cis-trans isomerase [Pseudomonadota bacterium]
MWILMALLILGLAGFGAVNLSGTVRSIGTVGEKSVPVDQYARELSQQINALSRIQGRQVPFAEAQAMGLDRAVLAQIMRARALDNLNDQIGLSIGDEALRDRLLGMGNFQGLDGTFDREGYALALRQSGLTEAEFELTLREEAARTLLQSAVAGGVTMPTTYAQTLVDFAGEMRSFTWARLEPEALEDPIPAPTPEDLQAYYEANPDRFMLPQTKRITYVLLTPDDMLSEVEVPEEQLRAAYDDRIDEYNRPERRLVERLVFADQESADRAAANLEVGGTTFDALVEERGLTLADVDLGDVGRLELDAAGEAVFTAEPGDVVGPLPSALGPALFRMNGVLSAQSTSFEDAREELRTELAADAAQRAVEARAQEYDDQLAGGVTLEQLAEETPMTLGSIDWTAESDEGLAAYADFREAAATLNIDGFPQIAQLEDGSIYAMRLEEELPERLAPFKDAQDDVRAAWEDAETVAALTARATDLVPELGEGDTAFEGAGLTAVIETDQTRNAFIADAPGALIEQVFEMTPGDVNVVPDEQSVILLRLDAVTPASESDESVALRERLVESVNAALAQDLFNVFNEAVLREAEPRIDPNALQAVHVNFP